MADRYDMCTGSKDKDGQTVWHRIGVAFPSKNGDGFDLVFNSLPIPEYSTEYGMQVRAKLFPAKPREPVNSSFEGENSQHQSDGLYKEDIPF
jgi:hypothetical protein